LPERNPKTVQTAIAAHLSHDVEPEIANGEKSLAMFDAYAAQFLPRTMPDMSLEGLLKSTPRQGGRLYHIVQLDWLMPILLQKIETFAKRMTGRAGKRHFKLARAESAGGFVSGVRAHFLLGILIHLSQRPPTEFRQIIMNFLL